MARTAKEKKWYAGMHVITVAFNDREYAKVREAMKVVEERQAPGWVNERGLNKGRVTVTRFVRQAAVVTAESLIE